jgi:hypothetical protein
MIFLEHTFVQLGARDNPGVFTKSAAALHRNRRMKNALNQRLGAF